MRIEGQLVARGSMEKSRLERRVREMLDVVSLGEFEARRPHQLSGWAVPAGGPNVAKDARRPQLERGQNSIDRLPMTTGYSSSPSFTSARVSPK